MIYLKVTHKPIIHNRYIINKKLIMTKNFIKGKLDLEKEKVSLSEFDNIAKKIHMSMKDSDYTEGKVKKTMARYSRIKNNMITFDTSFNSELDYHQLKEKMSETIETKPKKSSTNSDKSDKPNKPGKPNKFNYEDLLMGVSVENQNSDNEKPSKTDKIITSVKSDKTNKLDKSKTSAEITKPEKITKSEEESDTDGENESSYIYSFEPTKNLKIKLPPYGTDWIGDKKIHDDPIGKAEKRRTEIFNNLAQMKFPPQKSQAWLKLRQSVVSASDGGCTLGDNDYEPQHKLLYKKVMEPPFEPNENCYHGNKYEEIATMIYSYRTNVNVREFGLIKHPNCDFLGASPDGIITPYKCDNKHLTKYVGRMLEIKCPTSREIKTSGEIKGNICPIYYWDQVQLQLECCNLDECDFWQCKITEYDTRQDFINDTDPIEPFRSKTTGHEKGCVIQVLPLSKRLEAQSLKMQMKKHIESDEDMTDEEKNQPQHFEEVDNGDDRETKMERYYNIVYESSKHIYPPKIEMTPCEVDEWILNVTNNFHKQELLDNNLNIRDYYIDKVIFWKIEKTHCVTINRDVKWFESVKPTIQKMWDYVKFLRTDMKNGGDKAEILFNYTDSVTEKMKDFKNPKKTKDKKMDERTKSLIMEVVEDICTKPKKDSKAKEDYENKLKDIKLRTIKNNEIKKSSIKRTVDFI